MKHKDNSKRSLQILTGTALWMIGSVNLIAQMPPSRPKVIGNLELVASLTGDQPAGVAISTSGRLFVTFPRHDGDVAFTVGEIKDGRPLAYPTVEINHPAAQRPAAGLFSVQTLQVDASDHLWMLDTGTLQFGQPPVRGAAKLVEVDLASNRVMRTIVFPPEALVGTSALKDFRFDFHRGLGGTVFITDSAPGLESLIVLDIASGHAMRRLAGSPAVSARGGRTPIVGFEPLVEAGKGSEQGALKPWLVGLNALELSADCKTLYFSAFTGRRLYSIGEGDLSNPAVANEQLVSEITYVGDIGMAGHFVLDTDGSLYFMDMEQNAIYRRAPDGRVKAVVVDSRLMWPDTMVIGHDKYLYVTTSQHDRRPEFHDGEELRRQPYGLFRVYVGSQPIRAIER